MLTVDIEKTYGDFHLHASFESENAALALLGASGSGKSVTLRCIAGIDTPDRGRIVLDGRTLFDSEKRINLSPQQRCVGYLFQQYALFPNMTVEQNIAAGLRERDRAVRRARVAATIRKFQLTGTEKLYPRQLSGGQQQRVALCRILLSDPAAILLDEPFSALDGTLKWQLEQELRQMLTGFAGAVILVTHDAGEVCRCCERVVVLDRGASSPMMTTDALFRRPGTVAAAMLAGCHTFAPFEPQPDGNVLVPVWGLTLHTCRDAAGKRMLGIRDESIRLAEQGDPHTFVCRITGALGDVDGGLLTLLPIDAVPDAPTLRMALPRELWYTWKEEPTVRVSVAPADILLLS